MSLLVFTFMELNLCNYFLCCCYSELMKLNEMPVEVRSLIGLGICVPLRISLSAMVGKQSGSSLQKIGILALLPAVGFAYQFLEGNKTNFGQVVWWNNTRPFHAMMYFLFAYFALKKNKKAYLILTGDAVFSLLVQLVRNYNF